MHFMPPKWSFSIACCFLPITTYVGVADTSLSMLKMRLNILRRRKSNKQMFVYRNAIRSLSIQTHVMVASTHTKGNAQYLMCARIHIKYARHFIQDILYLCFSNSIHWTLVEESLKLFIFLRSTPFRKFASEKNGSL